MQQLPILIVFLFSYYADNLKLILYPDYDSNQSFRFQLLNWYIC